MIRPARPDDRRDIHAIIRAAFETAAEADLVDVLRDGGHALVELVAESDAGLVGHILFTALALKGDQDVLAGAALAPIAVRPDHQRRGVGGRLIAAGVDACRALELAAIVVLGHPAYYPRHGFSAAAARQLHDPFNAGEAFMALELRPGALSVPRRPVYAPAFGVPPS